MGARWLLFLLVVMVSVAHPTAYYVDPKVGNGDSGSGTLADPWQYVKSHITALAATDTLFFRGGTYDSTSQGGPSNLDAISPVDSTYLLAFPGESPIFDYTGVDVTNYGWYFAYGADEILLRGMTFKLFDDANHFMYIRGAQRVTVADCVFDSIATGDVGAQNTIYIDRALSSQAPRDITISGCSFYGHEKDDDQYRIRMRGNTDGSWILERITIEDCVFGRESDMTEPDGWGSGISSQLVDSLIIRGCTFWNVGNDHNGTDTDCIYLSDQNRNWIEDCRFERYNFGLTESDHMNTCSFLITGITGGCDTVMVRRCYIHGAGHGASLDGDVRNAWFEQCVFDSLYDDAVVWFDDARYGGARDCFVHMTGDDGFNINGEWITIERNTIVRPYDIGIICYTNADSCTIRDNIVYDARDTNEMAMNGSGTRTPRGNVWDGNIYYDPDDPSGSNVFAIDGTGNYSFAEWQAAGFDPNGQYVDPQFYSAAGDNGSYGSSPSGNLNVICGSPAIEGGVLGGVVGGSQRINDGYPFVTLSASAEKIKVFDTGGGLLLQDETILPLESYEWGGPVSDAKLRSVCLDSTRGGIFSAQWLDADWKTVDDDVALMIPRTTSVSSIDSVRAVGFVDSVRVAALVDSTRGLGATLDSVRAVGFVDSVRAVYVVDSLVVNWGNGSELYYIKFRDSGSLNAINGVHYTIRAGAADGPIHQSKICKVIGTDEMLYTPGTTYWGNAYVPGAYSIKSWNWKPITPGGTYTADLDPLPTSPPSTASQVNMYFFTGNHAMTLIDSMEVFVKPLGRRPRAGAVWIPEAWASVGLTDSNGRIEFEVTKSEEITADGTAASNPSRQNWELKAVDKRSPPLYPTITVREFVAPDSTNAYVFANLP